MQVPKNEEARLAAVALSRILDSGEQEIYNDLTKAAAYIAGTPMALISIIDKDRQWFKARMGVGLTETPREHSFCAHAILNPHMPFLVKDAKKDERFEKNPYVVGDPHVRFYFGAPLLTDKDKALGTLCVLDTKPCEIDLKQIDALMALSRVIMKIIDIHKHVHDLNFSMSKEEVLRDIAAILASNNGELTA